MVEREKTPGMEAEGNEDDGTFINISLADDPGRPHEISKQLKTVANADLLRFLAYGLCLNKVQSGGSQKPVKPEFC